jgi:tRNA(Arg) A34 adenosine deaminase TadA
MRYRRFLRLARQLATDGPLPDKQHLVVAVAFTGKHPVAYRLNSEAEHAEVRALRAAPEADRIVVYRFNRADPLRVPRTSCPCSRCCPMLAKSRVKKVEYMGPFGPIVVKVQSLKPYNKRYV